jgi:molybdopterin-guanine dinucleotide biosynthesis protein A
VENRIIKVNEMEVKKHQKHAKLTRRNNELYAPNEIAILGVKCSIITDFIQKIGKKLEKRAKIAYLDASHSDEIQVPTVDVFTTHHAGNLNANMATSLNVYNERIRFSNYDLVFINGNHYNGAKQILILDNEKEASVKKRLDQLDRVQFVIKLKDDSNYFDFLVAKYPTIKNLKCYHIDEVDAIANHIFNLVQETIAPIQGLVLAGGKSSRMGKDKGALAYHGKSQIDYSVELLEHNLVSTYVSVAQHQELSMYECIQDKFIGLGVFGAICSAFQQDPNKAWLVLATDLPFINSDLIQLLLKNRNPKKVATAIKGKSKEFVEPLITIYEPKAYPILLSYLAQGYSCPRKVLINSDVEIVEVDDGLIRNINTPEEYQEAVKEITSLRGLS